MGIEVNFSRSDVKRAFDNFLDGIERAQIRQLQKLGEMCLNEARLKGNYQDQTGNLRSSIGYTIFKDGTAIHSVYSQIKDGIEGVKSGEELAQKIGQDQPGVCLVVTAGMNYALYVESKGYNVLSSAEHLAERELPRMLEKLVSKIKE